MQPHVQDGDLIESIYAALLGEQPWQTFLDMLAGAIPDGKAVLFAQGFGANPEFSALHAGMTEKALDAYGSHFASRNPWIPAMEATTPGRSVAGHRLYPPDLFYQSEFYNDFLRPNDVETSGGLVIERAADVQFNLTVMSSQSSFETVDEWAAQFDRLSPHLRRAVAFYRRTAFAEACTELGGSFFDALHMGVVIVGAGRQVRMASDQARRMFGPEIGLDPMGRLRLRDETARTVLSAMLTRGHAGPRHHRLVAGGFLLTMVRMEGERERSFFEGPGACLTIEALRDGGRFFDIDHFARHHGLTPGEIRALSGLMAGKSVTEIAREAARSRETIRSQLKTLYAKTGARGQADLLRMVAGMRY